MNTISTPVHNDIMTTFSDDTLPVVATTTAGLIPYDTGDIYHDMNTILSRESLIRTDAFDPTATYNTPLENTATASIKPSVFDIPITFDLLRSPVIFPRLQNFSYLKFDAIKVKLKYQTNPTVPGKLVLFWYTAPGFDPRNQSIKCISAYPGSIFDINETTSTELTIPWAIPFTKLALNGDDIFRSGEKYINSVRLCLMVVHPPGFTSNENLTFKLYAQLENPQLVGPTLVPTTFQTIIPPTQQINASKTEAKNMASNGIISGVADGVAQIGNTLSSIPVIGTVAGYVGKGAGYMASIARAFGFSKPPSVEPLKPMLQQPFNRFGNALGVSNHQPITTFGDEYIEPSNCGLLDDKDETSVEYIGEREAATGTFSYSTSTTPDVVIYQERVTLTAPLFGGTLLSTPGEYVASLFEYASCRSIKYKLDVTKTPFHNGLLEVGVSFGSANVSAANYGDSNIKVQTIVMDLLQTKSIEIEVPYIFDRPWIRRPDLQVPPPALGYLYVKALAPLVANETVPQSINILVSKRICGLRVAGYSNLATELTFGRYFGNSRARESLPIADLVHREEILDESITEVGPLEYPIQQVNIGTNNDAARLDIGKPQDLSPVMVAHTTGESVPSIRPLWRIPVQIFQGTAASAKIVTKKSDYLFNPSILPFTALYIANRGGINLDFFTDAVSGTSRATYYRDNQPYTGTHSPFAVSDVYKEGRVQARIPYLADKIFYHNFETEEKTTDLTTDFTSRKAGGITLQNWASGADDFTFIGLRGAPAVGMDQLVAAPIIQQRRPDQPITTTP